jgi:hypothetical protein
VPRGARAVVNARRTAAPGVRALVESRSAGEEAGVTNYEQQVIERVDERAARASLRAQIARLECELGTRRRRGRADAARPRRARARARRARRARAGAAGERARTRRARAPRARAAAANGARPGQLQVRAAARARSRAGCVWGLGGPSAAWPDRHARRLVGAQAVVRLSVSQGVAVHARPRFTEVSIAASVRR